jgi:hypothetical protein
MEPLRRWKPANCSSIAQKRLKAELIHQEQDDEMWMGKCTLSLEAMVLLDETKKNFKANINIE